MKALSTSTRCGVRRPAEKELAPFQQASPKFHGETWDEPGPEGFPLGGNRSGVCCYGGMSFMS